MSVDDKAKVFQALSDPTRLAVFNCIRGCGGATGYDSETGECDAGEPNQASVCDVKCRIPCAPSTLSHHLSVLREAGLIATEKRGRRVYARILEPKMRELEKFFAWEIK